MRPADEAGLLLVRPDAEAASPTGQILGWTYYTDGQRPLNRHERQSGEITGHAMQAWSVVDD